MQLYFKFTKECKKETRGGENMQISEFGSMPYGATIDMQI